MSFDQRRKKIATTNSSCGFAKRYCRVLRLLVWSNKKEDAMEILWLNLKAKFTELRQSGITTSHYEITTSDNYKLLTRSGDARLG